MLEGAEPPGGQQVDGHDRERHGGEGSREGRVVGDAEVAVDDRADQLVVVAAHDRRRDEVAEREREREDRAGHDARERERQHDRAERRRALRAEIARGLDQRAGHALERCVDRQDHEGQPDVGERDRHRELREADLHVQPELGQQGVQDAAVVEDQAHAVEAHDQAREQRHGDQHEHEAPGAGRGDAREVIGEREGQRDVDDRRDRREPERARHDRAVDRVARQELAVVVEVPDVDGVRRELVGAPERLHEQAAERGQVDADEPRQRHGQQQHQLEPAVAEEEGGEPRERALRLRHGVSGRRSALDRRPRLRPTRSRARTRSCRCRSRSAASSRT